MKQDFGSKVMLNQDTEKNVKVQSKFTKFTWKQKGHWWKVWERREGPETGLAPLLPPNLSFNNDIFLWFLLVFVFSNPLLFQASFLTLQLALVSKHTHYDKLEMVVNETLASLLAILRQIG